ncbi:hypothetical protein NKG94_09555 [Micromonospora sp. M12]
MALRWGCRCSGCCGPLAWWVEPRESTEAQLDRDLAAGRVVTYQRTDGWSDTAYWGSRPELRPAERAGCWPGPCPAARPGTPSSTRLAWSRTPPSRTRRRTPRGMPGSPPSPTRGRPATARRTASRSSRVCSPARWPCSGWVG